ncbi:MAG: GNAT family N-acetyltransferase [Desulfobacteraceae bacterium]|nr:GNAT family N-acetyltransferase [Desulfobacteraceae bacterium]
MTKIPYWADSYVEKKQDADSAIRKINPGQRVFIGSACGEPQRLVRALSQNSSHFSGVEIVRMMSQESTSLTEIANKTHELNLSIRQFYLGAACSQGFERHMRYITPMNMSDVPALFLRRKMPINVALIQVCPPDDFGWMSLGISVDIAHAAAYSADLVIAQVNQFMPRIMGQSFIHVNDVDFIVEHDEELITIDLPMQTQQAIKIGQNISRLIDDGSTLQIGLDAASQATIGTMSEKNDLGFHSQYLTNDIMHLYAMGVINNRKKGFNNGKMVASAALGSKELYEFLHDNPAIEFHPSDYVNNPYIISKNNRMVSLNVAKHIDLTGQVTSEALAQTHFAGVSGIADFVRGARRSPSGKSILMLPSTTKDGKKSKIIPMMSNHAVVVPRGDVHYVATEFGIMNLFGKSLQERAMAIISIAHPDFRDELFEAAKELGLIEANRTLGEAAHAVYPVNLEETLTIREQKVTIRPAKTVDERRIKEHYYNLDKTDVFRRFFHEKNSFGRLDVEEKSHIDYIKDLTIIAVVGEAGFGRVVGLGEYLLLSKKNMAEVAFSISKDFQGKGLGKILLKKLAQAARAHGIAGLMAYTSADNKGMIRLFRSLPYKVKTSFDGDALFLNCKFDTLKDE